VKYLILHRKYLAREWLNGGRIAEGGSVGPCSQMHRKEQGPSLSCVIPYTLSRESASGASRPSLLKAIASREGKESKKFRQQFEVCSFVALRDPNLTWSRVRTLTEGVLIFQSSRTRPTRSRRTRVEGRGDIEGFGGKERWA